MSTIGILVFDGAEELDFVGPWEVLTASSALLEKDGAPPDRVMLVAERLDPVRCRKGMRVLPDVSFADHPPLDVVVVPGGEGTLLGSPNSAPMSFATCGGCATATW
jgi:putative intracellular protease/amidase